MRLLLLGGTWFLGRTLAAHAVARGWTVTAFTRGVSGRPPAGVDHVRGDRASAEDLRRLRASGPWDLTVDTSAYEPADVLRILAALGPCTGRYALISTVSAYRDWPAAPVDEDSPAWPSRLDVAESDPDVAPLPEPVRYGTLKAGCELAARTCPDGALIVRPGVILGPGEYVGRMLTLLNRAARGGDWLVPGPPEQPIQPVDVRDVSTFVLDRLAAGDGSVYNLTAPPGYASYADLVTECVRVTGSGARPVWVDPGWLAAQDVGQWTEVPLWRMPAGTWAVDSRRAVAAGFACRPLAETVADSWQAFRARPPIPHPRQAEHGMAAAREAELLRRWHAEPLRRG